MVGIRSVGWNLGTGRELLGGVGDIPSSVRGMATREGISPRLAYLVALPMVTAVYGSIMNALFTGEEPKELKDALFPRNGRMRKDGTADRLSLPSYMRDVAAVTNRADEGPYRILTNVASMTAHKLNPGISSVAQMLMNQNFHGEAIVNPADPQGKQTNDILKHFGSQLIPFSLNTFYRQKEQRASASELVLGAVGVTPAPAYVIKTNEQQRAAEQKNRWEMSPLEKKKRAEGTQDLPKPKGRPAKPKQIGYGLRRD